MVSKGEPGGEETEFRERPRGGDGVRLVLLGFPGAGKGTQGKLLSERYRIPRIATGDMFRAAFESGSTVGKQARAYVERGELAPDKLTIAIVRERLSQPDCEAGFVLDGFPRTVAQAEALDEMLSALDRQLEGAILLEVSSAEAVQRVSERRICGQCGATYPADDARIQDGRCLQCGGHLKQRDDDSAQTARRRLEVYQQNTQPVIDYYNERGLLVTVNGAQPIDDVFQQICRSLERLSGVHKSSSKHTGTGLV